MRFSSSFCGSGVWFVVRSFVVCLVSGQCRTIAIIARDNDVIHNILCGPTDLDTKCCG